MSGPEHVPQRQSSEISGNLSNHTSPATATGTHYILLRCQTGRVFFHVNADYLSLRERIVEQLKGQGTLLDYCLTPAEIRLLMHLHAGHEPGRFVQAHFSDWLRNLNKRDRRRGYVLAERTRIRSLNSAAEVRRVCCFLARYPVEEGLAATPSAYRYSGHRSHLGLEPAAGLGVRHVLSFFGFSIREGRDQLRQAVRTFAAADAENSDLRSVSSGRPRKATRQPRREPPGYQQGVARAEQFSQLTAEVEREVCARHGMSVIALFARPTPPGVAALRSVIVHVLTSARIARIATLARRYQRAPQTLKGEMQRHRRDPASAGLFNITLEDLLGADIWQRLSIYDRHSGLDNPPQSV